MTDEGLVLQPHIREVWRGGPSLLVVAAHGEGLLVAPPDRPMPEEIWADGIVEPAESEDASELWHREGHDRHQAIVSHRPVRHEGGIGRRPAPAPLIHQTTEEPDEPVVQKRLHPPAHGAAAAAQHMGKRRDGPAPRGPEDDLCATCQVLIAAELPAASFPVLGGRQRRDPEHTAPPRPATGRRISAIPFGNAVGVLMGVTDPP
jgi:hypothetical protein